MKETEKGLVRAQCRFNGKSIRTPVYHLFDRGDDAVAYASPCFFSFALYVQTLPYGH